MQRAYTGGQPNIDQLYNEVSIHARAGGISSIRELPKSVFETHGCSARMSRDLRHDLARLGRGRYQRLKPVLKTHFMVLLLVFWRYSTG